MIEVLKQMVEALQTRICSCCYESEICCAPAIKNAIQAGRQAIAELESQKQGEPVACKECHLKDTVYDLLGDLKVANLKLSVRSQRTWVGLTDEEIALIGYNNHPLDGVRSFARAIEAKLKQKNGFAEEKNT